MDEGQAQEQPAGDEDRLALLERKVDYLISFAEWVRATAEPFLKGKRAKYLALFAQISGSKGDDD